MQPFPNLSLVVFMVRDSTSVRHGGAGCGVEGGKLRRGLRKAAEAHDLRAGTRVRQCHLEMGRARHGWRSRKSTCVRLSYYKESRTSFENPENFPIELP